MKTPFYVINVLDEHTFDDCTIAGSKNIPFDDLESRSHNLNKHAHIVVYCASAECSLSREAWYLLKELGFDNVDVYEGGMREWKEKGYATEGECRAPYLYEEGVPLVRDHSVTTISAEDLKRLIDADAAPHKG